MSCCEHLWEVKVLAPQNWTTASLTLRDAHDNDDDDDDDHNNNNNNNTLIINFFLSRHPREHLPRVKK